MKRLQDSPSSKQASREEAMAVIATRNAFADKLLEKWNRRPEGAKLDRLYTVSKNKARSTAILLENQARHLKALRESGTQLSTSFSTTPENVLRIVRIGVANSNRPDIFTEWALTSTNDALYFVDKIFGTTIRGGVFGDRIYDHGADATNYPSEMDQLVLGTGDGTTTTFTGTATSTPLVPFTVRVQSGGAFVANDDGAGNISSTAVSTGTVNYATGAVSVTFATAPVSGASIMVEYDWNSEVAANYGSIGDVQIKVTRKRFNPRPQPLRYSYTKMVELVLGTTQLGDVEEMLVRAVGDEHAFRRDYKAFQIARRLALSNVTTTFDADFAAAGEDNDTNHAQRVLTTINNISTTIYNDIKRGQINKIVGSGLAVNYLKKHRLWKSDTSQPRVGGSYLSGKLDDIDVYVTPSDVSTVQDTSNSGELLCIFKNPQEEGEPSVAFGVLTELAAALDYPEFYRVGQIASVEDYLPIQPKFIRLLKIQNIV